MVDQKKNKSRLQEEHSTERQAAMLGFPYLNLIDHSITKESIADILSLNVMEQAKVVPLKRDGQRLFIGITLSTPKTKMEHITATYDSFNVQYVAISDSSYRDILLILNPPKEVELTNIDISSQQIQGGGRLPDNFGKLSGDQMLDYLLQQAVQLKATDIHLETDEEISRVRFRVDGRLYTIAQLSIERYRLIEGSIAIKADIGVASRVTQTGHMSANIALESGEVVEMSSRLETVPTLHGQDIVMRLFNLDPALLNIDNLGMRPEVSSILKEVTSNPKGLVLISGPTGSGKTTTLYSMLQLLNTEDKKVVTLENPVEAPFHGVTQISVDGTKDGSFADMLRSVLRLDPDVVMIGEIRDADTAKTAIHAALTGHLVLATFHATDSAAAIERLFDMVDHNPLFTSAIRAVVSQRLIRVINQDSQKTLYSPSEPIIKKLEDVLRRDVNGSELQLVAAPDKDTEMLFYGGRSIISEALEIDDEVESMLIRESSVGLAADIREHFYNKSVSILQDGMERVVSGETVIEEVMRVID